MNLANNNWVGAGRKLAFPVMQVGYPENSGGIDADTTEVFNKYRLEAENIVANVDATSGIVYPYTRDAAGEIQKAIDVEFLQTNAGKSSHLIFSEFNEAQKNEIREMIFGGTLTSSVGERGSLALGEIHMDKYKMSIDSNLAFELAVLNDEFLTKLRKFYKNMPEGLRFGLNTAKKWTVDEIVKLNPVIVGNGLKLTAEFFNELGLSPEYLEEREDEQLPQQTIGKKPQPTEEKKN